MNVMVILCDQLRPDYLSCYGNEQIKTPNIDSLYADGVLFEKAITASPVCAPGRACMMTGRYVSDHNVWTNDVAFREGIDFLPQRMKDNGYRCGAFGKLHHFPGKDSKGFDVALQMEERRLAEEDDYYKYLKKLHPEITDLYGHDKSGHFAYPLSEYYEHWMADKTIEFIEANKANKFFTWTSFQGPHGPMDAPADDDGIAEWIEMEDAIDVDRDAPAEVVQYRRVRNGVKKVPNCRAYRSEYAKMIQLIDYEVGRIISYLKENNLYEETVIIFSTDHGDMAGDYGLFQKGPMLYKAQLEVPMIVANHPNLPKLTRSDILTSNIDIGATALDAAGDQKPLGYSRSIVKMYNDADYERKVIYAEFCDSMKLVSTKEYRMAYYPFTGECELVKIDEETTDLSQQKEYQQLKIKLLQDIIDFMVLARTVRIETQDLTPKVQEGLVQKWPNYKNEIPIVFPISSQRNRQNLIDAGLDGDYNEFCIARDDEIVQFYGKYWSNKRKFEGKY
ncbi:sulfatase [Candidatus Epulonipiscium viviparus]|uniref:sulfatase family protein n=1 Tax=Candidatus Epulonipiscium viviparus TaxID=420336 RepID=UPI00273808B8|nr:sulfatase-like hydrolase/transferase [Candidatus Epulopiscium viviparus]